MTARPVVWVPAWLEETFRRAEEALAKTPPENRPHWLAKEEIK